jgi:hypothetical protein
MMPRSEAMSERSSSWFIQIGSIAVTRARSGRPSAWAAFRRRVLKSS